MPALWMEGDILQSTAHTLVNPVNCVGIMGKGLAKAFAARFPPMFLRYQKACRNQRLQLGKCVIDRNQNPWIVNFPTKNHWRHKSDLDMVAKGLTHLGLIIHRYEVESIALPALGCGEGGLRWRDVCPLIEAFGEAQEIPVFVYDPPEP